MSIPMQLVSYLVICVASFFVVCACDLYRCFKFQSVKQFFLKASFSIFMVCLALLPFVDVVCAF